MNHLLDDFYLIHLAARFPTGLLHQPLGLLRLVGYSYIRFHLGLNRLYRNRNPTMSSTEALLYMDAVLAVQAQRDRERGAATFAPSDGGFLPMREWTAEKDADDRKRLESGLLPPDEGTQSYSPPSNDESEPEEEVIAFWSYDRPAIHALREALKRPGHEDNRFARTLVELTYRMDEKLASEYLSPSLSIPEYATRTSNARLLLFQELLEKRWPIGERTDSISREAMVKQLHRYICDDDVVEFAALLRRALGVWGEQASADDFALKGVSLLDVARRAESRAVVRYLRDHCPRQLIPMCREAEKQAEKSGE